jgi:hypothetical protein
MPVLRFEHSGLAAFYSENATPELWFRAPLKPSAAEFHRVQQELFRTEAIIPFRFPTILENQDALRTHLDERSTDYKAWLRRFADYVQMDLSLTHATGAGAPSSGADYLRQRQSRTHLLEHFASDLRQQATPLLKDWRQRSAQNGLRCYALLDRKQVVEFNEKIERISVPEDINARMSGPWPVAEFLDFKS